MFSVAWLVMISGDAGDRAVGSRGISLWHFGWSKGVTIQFSGDVLFNSRKRMPARYKEVKRMILPVEGSISKRNIHTFFGEKRGIPEMDFPIVLPLGFPERSRLWLPTLPGIETCVLLQSQAL
jgi:hypothetical protein